MNGQLDLVKTSSVVSLVAVHSAKICSYPQPMEKATLARVATHFDLDEQGRALRECRAMKTMARLLPILLTFALVCFALVQNAQAVNPPPDGGYPGENTAEGTRALLSLVLTAFNNTAIGFLSLQEQYTERDANTAVGAGALFSNRGEGQNTATGAGALFNSFGANNTANGAFALYTNGLGSGNTAMGSNALYSNRTAFANTAIGYGALFNNTGELRPRGRQYGHRFRGALQQHNRQQQYCLRLRRLRCHHVV